MHAVDLLIREHRDVQEVFDRYEQLGEDAPEERRQLARQVIEDLVQHAAMEERAFYPAVKQARPDLADEIDHDLQEHREAEELLADLDGSDPTEASFDATFGKLIAAVRHHIGDEERDLFPLVRETFTDQELERLGQAMEEIRKTAPTRPHPHAPQEPATKALADSAAAILDELRDSVRKRRDRETV